MDDTLKQPGSEPTYQDRSYPTTGAVPGGMGLRGASNSVKEATLYDREHSFLLEQLADLEHSIEQLARKLNPILSVNAEKMGSEPATPEPPLPLLIQNTREVKQRVQTAKNMLNRLISEIEI